VSSAGTTYFAVAYARLTRIKHRLPLVRDGCHTFRNRGSLNNGYPGSSAHRRRGDE